MKTLHEKALELQALFASKARWTKGELAKTEMGDGVSPTAPFAVCWCLDGGIARIETTVQDARSNFYELITHTPLAQLVLEALAKSPEGENFANEPESERLFQFNDTSTFKRVQEVLQLAVDLSKEER